MSYDVFAVAQERDRWFPLADGLDMGDQPGFVGCRVRQPDMDGEGGRLVHDVELPLWSHIQAEWVTGRRSRKSDGTAERCGDGPMDMTGQNTDHVIVAFDNRRQFGATTLQAFRGTARHAAVEGRVVQGDDSRVIGCLRERRIQPGAAVVLISGARPKGQEEPKLLKNNKVGFVVWRNGRTSIFRSPEQIDLAR